MRRDIDSKDTIYTVTFPECSFESLVKLSRVVEGLMPEADVDVKAETGYCHIGITVYEDLEQ